MISWIFIAIFAYFLIALQVILDKFMLSSKRVAHPATFAFYTGILSFFTIFVFLPFGGLHAIAPGQLIMSLFSGVIFSFGIVFIFFAIQKNQASQVIPVVGAITPIATYLMSFLFQTEKLNLANVWGVVLLILGGLLISFDLPLKLNKKKFFSGFYYSVLGGFLLGVAFSLFKEMYLHDNFTNVFVWTRLGLFAGGLLLLAIPNWRKHIIASITGFHKKRQENSRTGLLFVFNKILGGTGSLLLNYAIALGSVTIVNALNATEYVFVLAAGILFSVWHPKIFQESGKFWDIAQKIISIFIITAGIALISIK